MIDQVVGVVATNWLIIADQKRDILDSDCLKLAKLHSDAVDYQKTGRQVPLDEIPKPKHPMPDWNAPETIENMSRQEGKYYRSETALGKLTRAIDLKAHEPSSLPRYRPKRRGQTAVGRVENLVDELSSLGLGDNATSVIFDALEPLVARFFNPHARVSARISDSIVISFKSFTEELRSIASRHSLSSRSFKPLSEEELIIGTITQKTTQPAFRREKIAKMKESADYAVRKVRDNLEGEEDRAPKEYLRFAWTAWKLSLVEMRKRTFGAKAFWCVTLGAVFDAIKIIEEAASIDMRSAKRAAA